MPEGIAPLEAAKRARRDDDAPLVPTVEQKSTHTKHKRAVQRKNRAERMVKMAVMFADGASTRKIAERVGLSQSVVVRDIDLYVRKLETQALEHIARRISRSEAVFRSVQMEASIAWFASQDPRKIVSTKRVKEIRSGMSRKRLRRGAAVSDEALDEAFGGASLKDGATPDNESTEHSTRTETQVGNPDFLRIIIDCEKQIMTLRKLVPKDGDIGTQWGSPDGIRRLTQEDRFKLLHQLVEKAQLRQARQLALGEGGPVIDVTASHIETVEVAQNRDADLFDSIATAGGFANASAAGYDEDDVIVTESGPAEEDSWLL